MSTRLGLSRFFKTDGPGDSRRFLATKWRVVRLCDREARATKARKRREHPSASREEVNQMAGKKIGMNRV